MPSVCECGNTIKTKAKRCLQCFHKGQRREKNVCACGKIIKPGAKSCQSCHYKNRKGKNGPGYKGGQSSMPEYRTYYNMLRRCGIAGKGDDAYACIDVCDRWIASFWNFYEDMGPKPGPEYSIDREDPTKGYNPDNCRWLLKVENDGRIRSRWHRPDAPYYRKAVL